MGEILVIESGDYEQRGVDGVAVSHDAAVRFVRAMYGPPYVVEWTEDEHGMTGKFASVPGYSTQHVARYSFTPYELVD